MNLPAAAANSSGGADIIYGASGWSSTDVPLLIGTPDVTSDAIPDIWAVKSNGSARLQPGRRTSLTGTGSEIIGPASYWQTRIAIG
ncbi:hypothetical protein ACH40F_40430 [Streptomyces sp. NPDC020794]|uniref:hypothetical protein n=1 Tax=unclassified Streptomyces TaxID=2593676 RepID=UPI0036EBEB12